MENNCIIGSDYQIRAVLKNKFLAWAEKCYGFLIKLIKTDFLISFYIESYV